MKVIIIIITLGHGFGNSAANELVIVIARPMKLQIPIAVALL